MDRIVHPAGSAAEFSLKNFLLVLLVSVERKFSLTNGAAENIHK
jgi:hypothetical protein